MLEPTRNVLTSNKASRNLKLKLKQASLLDCVTISDGLLKDFNNGYLQKSTHSYSSDEEGCGVSNGQII